MLFVCAQLQLYLLLHDILHESLLNQRHDTLLLLLRQILLS
jgi:hypothetical protein